jgi:steroid 5-alpha reductase family enzyme
MISLSGMGAYVDGAILTFGIQFVGFTVAAILQTEIFYDVLGGINFLVLAVFSMLGSSDENLLETTEQDPSSATIGGIGKNTVFGILFAISRGWLLVFLAWRAHHRKGDARFDGVRDVPSRFFVFWMVQALWVFCISLPLLVVVAANDEKDTTPNNNNDTTVSKNIDYSSLMLLGMACSIFVEIRSDIVKANWVSSGRPGGFCANGPWKHSRHPNYAGEILTWVFAACYAVMVSNVSSWQSIAVAAISPLFTLHLLLNTPATGVWNAEGKNLKRYFEHTDPTVAFYYEEYRRTTPPVFPTFVIPYESLPLEYQRRFCFEWERFEYKP